MPKNLSFNGKSLYAVLNTPKCHMSDDPNAEEQLLASKATIAMTKTAVMKKGLARGKKSHCS
jgi:hypothetical protein